MAASSSDTHLHPANHTSEPTGPTTTFHLWPRLPTELKLKVLSHLLPSGQEIYYNKYMTWHTVPGNTSHQLCLRNILAPLIATKNTLLATLAQETYYQQNTFCLNITNGWSNNFRRPKEGCAKRIRHLMISTCLKAGYGRLQEGFSDEPQILKRLLAKRSESVGGTAEPNISLKDDGDDVAIVEENSDAKAWQSFFTNLHTLTIHVQMWDSNEADDIDKNGVRNHEGCCIHPAKLEATKKSLDGFEIPLKAKKVKVIVEVGYERCSKKCYRHSDVFGEVVRKSTKGLQIGG